MKLKPCTTANGKHKWVFNRNFADSTSRGSGMSITLRGLYTCTECRLTKKGNPSRDGDLRDHNPLNALFSPPVASMQRSGIEGTTP